jgi:hypothetical protein
MEGVGICTDNSYGVGYSVPSFTDHTGTREEKMEAVGICTENSMY